MCAYNAGQPRQETQELYLTDGKSLSVSNGRFPNRTLYLQNVPNGHWYHFYIVSCSLLWRKVHVSKLKHHHVTYSPTSTELKTLELELELELKTGIDFFCNCYRS